MHNKDKTIELLSTPYTSQDVWTEFNREVHPSQLFLYLSQNVQYKIRLLGPFMSVRRLYVPKEIKEVLEGENIYSVMNGNREVYERIIASIEEKRDSLSTRSGKKSIQQNTIDLLTKMVTGQGWSNCVLVNSLVRGEGEGEGLKSLNLKVLAINRTIADAICSCGMSNKISGLEAQDILITRGQRGTNRRSPNTFHGNSEYNVSFLNKSYLDENEINFIFSKGLIDIPVLIDEVNKRQSGQMFYKCPVDYKMSDELMADILEQAKIKEEDLHFEKATEEINKIPKNSLERNNMKFGPISGLEVE